MTRPTQPAAAPLLTLAPSPTDKEWEAMTDAQAAELVAANARLTRQNLRRLIDRGALFVVCHSGGKDSQMLNLWAEACIPAEQIVRIHATLGRFEWSVLPHIRATIASSELHIAQAIHADKTEKTFGTMVVRRGMMPSKAIRQCTSDLKRGPIEVVVRRVAKERGAKLIVVLTGVRADEGDDRARSCVRSFSVNKNLSKAGREVYDAAPLADWTTAEVFEEIARRGQSPHPNYAKGMTRISCCFCILAKRSDLRIAAELRPDLYAELVATELHIGHTMKARKPRKAERAPGLKAIPVPLEQFTGIQADPKSVRRHLNVLQSTAA